MAKTRAEGACAWCGEPLPAGRRSWCSDRCGDAFWANHWWSVARHSAKRRDRYSCRRCGTRGPKRPVKTKFAKRAAYLTALRAWREQKLAGRLEVNHIRPAAGRHRELSCVHHLDNLETLCLACHKAHTATLRAEATARSSAARAAVENASRPGITMQ